MQEGYWTAGIDIGVEVTQVSYMTEGMTDPVTLDTLFETGKDISFIKNCILAIPGLEDPALLGGIDIILPEFTLEAAEKVKQACIKMGIAEEKIHLQGVEEASIYFALSQERSLWNNDVIFFDFSKEGLIYRSLHIEKQSNGSIVTKLISESVEGIEFNEPSDEVFLQLARARMDRRLISAVYLIGEGFYKEEWAKESLKYLCSRRRVFMGLNLYTRGAAFAAYDRIHSRAYDHVLFLCKNRLFVSVGLSVVCQGEEKLLYLAKSGTNWHEVKADVEAIPDEISEITLVLQSLKGEQSKEKVSLENFPKRERRMTRLEIQLSFLNEEYGVLTIKDLGFGSLIKPSEAIVKKNIWIRKRA